MNFAQPAWLILLVLLPILAAGAVLVAQFRRNQWAAFVAPRLRATLLKRRSPLPRWFALLFLLAACASLIAALARPRADAGSRTEKSLGRNVLIAIDLSRSMRVADVKPDRLTQAKVVIYELLEAMPNERIGLLGFAGDAYEFAPLTVDHGAVRETVEQLDETWAPRGGSNIAEVLHLATDTLKKTGQKNNALVIISDGEQNEGDLDDMIREARQSGVYILTIGVGTEDGDYVPNSDFPGKRMIDQNGKPVISRLQPEVMRKLATETKGRYAAAGSGTDIPAMVKSAITDLDAFEMEGRERVAFIEFYQWLLLPAILFLFGSIIAGTRWRGVNPALSAVLCLLFFTPISTRADEVSAAKQALQQKRYPEATMAYRALAEDSKRMETQSLYHLGEATAAYRSGNFNDARHAYSQALLSQNPRVLEESHLGMGDTLFQAGWKTLTGGSYPTDSDKLPDMKRFDGLVKEQLTKLMESKTPSQGETPSSRKIETLVTDWSDAVRHFDSILKMNPQHKAAENNRALTIAYLNRLRELLEEEKQETEDSMPPEQPGPGQPKSGEPGDGEPQKQPKGDQNDPESKSPGGEKQDDSPPKDPNGEKKDPDANGEPKKDDDSEDGKKDGKNSDETPAQQAKRILKENADLEKGPLTPGRHEFRNPEKDW